MVEEAELSLLVAKESVVLELEEVTGLDELETGVMLPTWQTTCG
jgi:hypothetical protein